MNTKVLALGAVVAAFTFTSFAAEPLLSPRAAGNQIKTVSNTTEAPVVAIAYVDTSHPWLSPRAAGNQIKVVKGVVADVNPALECRRNMPGTPRIVTECSSHTTMPVCTKLTAMK